MKLPVTLHRLLLLLLVLLTRPSPLSALNSDGFLLLSFKYSILSDPLSALGNWNLYDQTPCRWNGVQCTDILQEYTWSSRVTSLVLPYSKLLGSIPADFGKIDTLQQLDLSNNFLNGTIPLSLFNATDLRMLSLSNNEISGELPEAIGTLKSLQFLNLSDNALTGKVPASVASIGNLSVLSLSNNYFYGGLPTGFQYVEVVDLSSNLLNGSLPSDFIAEARNLRSLNLSYNRFSGEISPGFASAVPANASLDLSFNNLTGGIPDSFLNRSVDAFGGNPDLCGKPLKKPCPIPSTLSTPPNVSTSTSPLAIAAIPKTLDSPKDGSAAAGNGTRLQGERGLKPGLVAVIVVGDLAGIGIVSLLVLYLYQSKKTKKEKQESEAKKTVEMVRNEKSLSPDSRKIGWPCLRKEESSSSSNGEEASESTESETNVKITDHKRKKQSNGGGIVSVDGGSEIELETLLKASAYVLGATGPTIVYKAVLEDGTAFAVRRIGECRIEKPKDFEYQVRMIAKLQHPNLVRLRGFYWGDEDKLVIYDYAPNGSLASASSKKVGSSSCHLSWDVRLRIARGVARGLMFLHEKKHIHGNIKPSNILLGPDMEPTISDFGLEWLVLGNNTNKGAGGSAQHLSSKPAMVTREGPHELQKGASATVSMGWCTLPYHAPESLKNLKPNPKWDVYSFGVVILELISGKMFSDKELSSQWIGSAADEKGRVLMMADGAIRAEIEGKEEALLSCFKLGFSCASTAPQKRPSMKEALQILEKMPS